MKQIKCKIQGISPLLMNRFPMEEIKGFAKLSKEEQAEIAAYRDDKTKGLYVPGIGVHRCLINGAKFSKGKGRASLMTEFAACVIITPEYLDLKTKNYEIDSRAVVVPATKGRIIRHRPKLHEWAVMFDLEYDEELLSERQVREVVDNAGKRVGLLDFRPQNKGPFGRFVVVEWNLNGK